MANHILYKLLVLAMMVLVAVHPAGAGEEGGGGSTTDAKEVQQPAQLVWPPAPLEPRIRYLKSISTSDDIVEKKGFWRRFWEFFRGPQVNFMVKPMAVAADSRGRIYVSDPAAKLVHLFDPEKGKYRSIDAAGKQMLQFPINLAIDSADNLYVVDGQRRQIFVLTPRSRLKQVYGKPGQLQRPSGIAVDSQRRVLYIADPPAHDIKIFSLNDSKLLGSIGRRGTAPGEFNFPTWLALDKTGRLYVTDSLNGRIQILSHEGQPLSSIGQLGVSTGSFSSPKGIALDSDGHLYVNDAGFDNVQIFDNKGRLLLYFGGSGQAPGTFWMPGGVFIDHNDRIYIADSYNKRIQIFQYMKSKVSP